MSESLLFISAGDPSGDNATSRLVDELKKNHPSLAYFGLGGPRLLAHGQEQLASHHDLAVLGFWEVLKRASYFRNLLKNCEKVIETRRPNCILLVDYPGFNLRLAKRVKRLGIPIVYYISPQIWAWGKRRIGLIKRLVDQMIVILPFEEQFYQNAGVPVEFVGHYLLEDIPAGYISSAAPKQGKIALLPGSRPQEIDRMLKPMLDAAANINRRHGTTAVVAAVNIGYDYESIAAPYASSGISVSYESSRKLLYESDLALTASGTATLETGIIGRPMVIVYKTGFITYLIARTLVTIDKIGLVNLVLGEKVVPELIQNEVSPQRMASELTRYLDDRSYADKIKCRLDELPGILGGPGASARAAQLIGRYL
jgi:lipid-A-disaccharide synthase